MDVITISWASTQKKQEFGKLYGHNIECIIYIYKTVNEMTKAIITTECTLHSIYKFTHSDFACE
jgi:hypothetical protein